jgi:sigma-E factor negative regulatory protein RseC
MKKIGQVVHIDKEEALVKVPRASSCGDNCSSCSSGCSDSGHIIRIKNDDYHPGEFVELKARAKNVLLYSVLAYGLPLIIMIATIAYSMNTLKLGETVAGLMGLVSLIASNFIMKAIDKYVLKDTLIIEDIRKL